jgi:hypothetical protein
MRLIATDVRHANLNRSDEPIGMVDNDGWIILRIQRRNNRRV